MINDQNLYSKTRNINNDGIDIIELFLKIWRWKWLTLGIMIVITTIAIIIPSQKTYTTHCTLNIGTVGTFTIETPEMMINTLKKMINNESVQLGLTINEISTQESFDKFDAIVTDKTKKFVFKIKSMALKKSFSFTIQSNSSINSEKWANKIGDYFIKKHQLLYEKSLKQAQNEIAELKRMNVMVTDKYINTKLMFDNQSYPTEYLIKPSASSIPDSNFSKSRLVRAAIGLITSIILGAFISLLIDFLIKIKKELKIRSKED